MLCRNEKGLLNFVNERIIFLKLVYRINNTWYSFKKNKLPFRLVKPHFVGRILSNLSPYLEAGETQLKNTCLSTVRDSRIRSEMSWNSINAYKIWTLRQRCITVHSIWIMKIFNIMFPNTCSRNKRRTNCKESRWRS